MQNKTIYLLLIFVFFSSTTWAQQNSGTSSTDMNLTRSITLENHSDPEQFEIEIPDKTKSFDLMIKSEISDGEVTISIYSPDDLKAGTSDATFTVGTQLQTNQVSKEVVSGNYVKRLTDPQTGLWRVEVIPTNASGKISIRTFFKL